MTKKELRKLFKERRVALLPSEIAAQSQAIARLFFASFPVADFQAIHCYLPIRRQNEVDTLPLIDTLQQQYPNTNVVIPRSLPETGEMEHYQWTSGMELLTNQWGILEPNPSTSTHFPVSKIDLVIIPLLAFDHQGNRVGYGKGFYDRFLAQCRSNVLKVGVCFFDPVATITDANDFDVRLDYCITPTNIWRFPSTP
jgi:5-formyltetrahydrofolate cyclo-ligase